MPIYQLRKHAGRRLYEGNRLGSLYSSRQIRPEISNQQQTPRSLDRDSSYGNLFSLYEITTILASIPVVHILQNDEDTIHKMSGMVLYK